MIEKIKHWSATAKLTAYKESVLSADQLDEIAAYIGGLQQKLDAMAAENAALKDFGDKLNDMYNNLNGEGTGIQGHAEVACQQAALEAAIEEFDTIATPATDAYLNSVRAEGVEMYANHFNVNHTIVSAMVKSTATEFADQLRSGTNDTADKAG